MLVVCGFDTIKNVKNRPRPRDFWLILMLGALCTLTPFAVDLYLPAFSQIAEALKTTPARIAFSLSSYFVGLAAGQLLYGPLLDRFGRRPPLLIGLSVFIAASAACMFADSVEALIVFRFFQALGGCVAQVASMAMVRDFFPVKDAARIFSMLVLMIGLSPLLAPTIGGWISASFAWQMIFAFLTAMGLVVTATVAWFCPKVIKLIRRYRCEQSLPCLVFIRFLEPRSFAPMHFQVRSRFRVCLFMLPVHP